MEAWLTTHWFDLIQSAGIVGALIFNLDGRREDRNTRKLKNLNDLVENHREIWRDYAVDPGLGRVKARDVDLTNDPITLKEDVFVRSIVTHLLGAYEATRLKEVVGLAKLGEDAAAFFSYPIPNAVWQDMKGVQDADFIQFVESAWRDTAQF